MGAIMGTWVYTRGGKSGVDTTCAQLCNTAQKVGVLVMMYYNSFSALRLVTVHMLFFLARVENVTNGQTDKHTLAGGLKT